LIEALSIAAQVAVGLAGFAGVAVLLGRGPGSWHPVDAVRIRGLLYAAFGALFASLVPVGLLLSGVAEAISVRCGSVAILAVIFLWGRTMSRAMGGSDEASRATFNRRVAVVIMTITFVTALAQVVNIAGVAGAASPGIFFFGVLLLLGYAAFGFVRLMFVRPSGG
jgi:hypothetical protein